MPLQVLPVLSQDLSAIHQLLFTAGAESATSRLVFPNGAPATSIAGNCEISDIRVGTFSREIWGAWGSTGCELCYVEFLWQWKW